MINKRILTLGVFVLSLFYPLLMYVGLKRYSPKLVALILGALLLGRYLWRGNREGKKRLSLVLLPPLALCIASAVVNDRKFILYLPVLVSLVLLISFGFTLFHPPSAVETLARISVPDLTADEAAHCRRTTHVWVGFFFVNGSIAFWTARWGSLEMWGLYNGFVTYVIMGGIFAAEFIYRHWRFRRYIGLPTDPLLRRLFPPKV